MSSGYGAGGFAPTRRAAGGSRGATAAPQAFGSAQALPHNEWDQELAAHEAGLTEEIAGPPARPEEIGQIHDELDNIVSSLPFDIGLDEHGRVVSSPSTALPQERHPLAAAPAPSPLPVESGRHFVFYRYRDDVMTAEFPNKQAMLARLNQEAVQGAPPLRSLDRFPSDLRQFPENSMFVLAGNVITLRHITVPSYTI